MPIRRGDRTVLVDGAGEGHSMSEAEFASAVSRLPDAGAIYSEQHDATDDIRLFDVVDRTWTMPLPQGQVYGRYLKKKVAKCSACTFTDANDSNAVQLHQQRTRWSAEIHENAGLIDATEHGERIVVCSACKVSFMGYKIQRANQHIFDQRLSGPQHDGATVQVMNRFSLEPVELPSSVPTHVGNGHQDGELEASPVGGTVPLQTRKRKRHRNRRAGRG
jgi:hypothetical protein